MDRSPDTAYRSRQACEPCRRKKTKCPGERPTCSFCARLNHQCVYLPRVRSSAAMLAGNSASVKRGTKDRVRVLESQINDIYQALCSPSREASDASPSISQRVEDLSVFSFTNFDPPAEIWAHFVEVYRRDIHLQPLPLLNLDGLLHYIKNAPQFLRWSFLALSMTFSSHPFYTGRELDAIDFYSRSAEDAVNRMATEGIARVEVVVSSCLLALKHIKACKAAQAWMAVGTACRLEALRSLTEHSTESYYRNSLSCCCYWSIYILERMFSPKVEGTPEIRKQPGYPTSCPIPPPPSTTATDLHHNPPFNDSEGPVTDLGIIPYFIQLVSVWGEISLWLRAIHSGKSETAWSPNSSHAKLVVKLHEFEAGLSEKHLFRNVLLPRRTPAELAAQGEYWKPWLLMQLLSHASTAMLNHPFIHLVATRGAPGTSRSRLFLQQTVDLSLFHSGWVVRLTRTCEELGFEIQDPLIGHLVAAIATIPWIFQFSKDVKVANKAAEDLRACQRLLSQISTKWSHISSKLDVLQSLQTVATGSNGGSDQSTTIAFQPSMLWALLDPDICQVMDGHENAGGVNSIGVEQTKMRVPTHFVHPLEEQPNHPEPACVSTNTADLLLPGSEDLETICMDDFFAHFASDEAAWLYPS